MFEKESKDFGMSQLIANENFHQASGFSHSPISEKRNQQMISGFRRSSEPDQKLMNSSNIANTTQDVGAKNEFQQLTHSSNMKQQSIENQISLTSPYNSPLPSAINMQKRSYSISAGFAQTHSDDINPGAMHSVRRQSTSFVPPSDHSTDSGKVQDCRRRSAPHYVPQQQQLRKIGYHFNAPDNQHGNHLIHEHIMMHPKASPCMSQSQYQTFEKLSQFPMGNRSPDAYAQGFNGYFNQISYAVDQLNTANVMPLAPASISHDQGGELESLHSCPAAAKTRIDHDNTFGQTSDGRGVLQKKLTYEGAHILVNAKQFHRILKRRTARARLQERNQFSKERKPYMHESRHKHAIRRRRGPSGRFLTSEEVALLESQEAEQRDL